MGIYAQFDERGPCHQVGTACGWGAFVTWVEGLRGCPLLQTLCEEGCMEDIRGVQIELQTILKERPPADAGVASVARALAYAIDASDGSEVLLITNGMTFLD